MSEYELHRPNFSQTTRNNWEFPSAASVDTGDLSTVADRFLLSASGFDDPDTFDDLALPVVTERGELSYNALWAAKRGPYGVDGLEDIDDETRVAAEALIDDLGNEQFDGLDDVRPPGAWAERERDPSISADDGPENDDTGVISVGHAIPSSTRAAVGLLFLAGGSVAIDRLRG
jgi:hypothetical protein